MNTKTCCYKNYYSFMVVVIDITGERRKALLNAVKGTMNECYGEKVLYADGVMRYPWEREPYKDVIERINGLSDTAETLPLFGGFYEITKFSLKRYAPKNALCNEMLLELEKAESEPREPKK